MPGPYDVPTSALLGDASRSAARRERDRDQIALIDLRRVLTPARGLGGTTVGPATTVPPTMAGVRAAIHAVDAAYHADDYAATFAALPSLLTEATTLVDVVEGDARADTYDLLAQAHQITGTALIQLRAFDLAYRALSLALDAADRSGNTLIGASMVTTMCWLLLRQGRFAEAEELAVTTADAIEPRFSRARPAELTTWGRLLLRAAPAAARDNRADDAETLRCRLRLFEVGRPPGGTWAASARARPGSPAPIAFSTRFVATGTELANGHQPRLVATDRCLAADPGCGCRRGVRAGYRVRAHTARRLRGRHGCPADSAGRRADLAAASAVPGHRADDSGPPSSSHVAGAGRAASLVGLEP